MKGFLWTNVQSEARGTPHMFCRPPNTTALILTLLFKSAIIDLTNSVPYAYIILITTVWFLCNTSSNKFL